MERPMNEARVLDVLALTHAIIADGWTQGAYSRNTRGQRVNPTSPDARRYCLVGAMNLALATRGEACLEVLVALLEEGGRTTPGKSLHLWKDQPNRTASEVLTLVENAAARVGKG